MSEHGSSPTQLLARPKGRIALDVAGEGPLVICAPGMGDLRSVFRFLRPDLIAAGFRVATMDLRGHGDSEATFDSYDDVATGEDLVGRRRSRWPVAIAPISVSVSFEAVPLVNRRSRLGPSPPAEPGVPISGTGLPGLRATPLCARASA